MVWVRHQKRNKQAEGSIWLLIQLFAVQSFGTLHPQSGLCMSVKTTA